MTGPYDSDRRAPHGWPIAAGVVAMLVMATAIFVACAVIMGVQGWRS